MRSLEVVADDLQVRLIRIEQTLHLREALNTGDLMVAMITRMEQPTCFNGSEVISGCG